MQTKGLTTQSAAELAMPRWYAAEFPKLGSGNSSVRSKNVKRFEQTVRQYSPDISIGDLEQILYSKE
jgi:hypothetical protein